MAAKIQSIIDRITHISNDEGHVRWTLPEIAHWLNDAQDQIASLHPRASAQYVTLTLQAGIRQDLRTIEPSKRWLRLHELVANMEGNQPSGPTIRLISRPALDFAVREWRRSGSQGTLVKEYAMDEREPFTFDVNPPVQAGVKVYALASAKPPRVMSLQYLTNELSNPNEEFGLADGYDIPAVDYVLFRMFSKDANDPAYAGRAATHLQAFQLAMGVETGDARMPA